MRVDLAVQPLSLDLAHLDVDHLHLKGAYSGHFDLLVDDGGQRLVDRLTEVDLELGHAAVAVRLDRLQDHLDHRELALYAVAQALGEGQVLRRVVLGVRLVLQAVAAESKLKYQCSIEIII